jgi:ATP-dependent DNA ligase
MVRECDGPIADSAQNTYPRALFEAFDFWIPTKSETVPTGPDWLHEVKSDCYRLRLITRGGYNWTDRYRGSSRRRGRTWKKRFVIDGQAVILGVDGVSDFNALHFGKHNDEVQLYAGPTIVPDRPDWLHEIKYDGYRLRLSTQVVPETSHQTRWGGDLPVLPIQILLPTVHHARHHRAVTPVVGDIRQERPFLTGPQATEGVK